MAPARCATAVSTAITRARLATMAAVSAKLSTPQAGSMRRKASRALDESLSTRSVCRLTNVAPPTPPSGARTSSEEIERARSFSNIGLPFPPQPDPHAPSRQRPHPALDGRRLGAQVGQDRGDRIDACLAVIGAAHQRGPVVPTRSRYRFVRQEHFVDAFERSEQPLQRRRAEQRNAASATPLQHAHVAAELDHVAKAAFVADQQGLAFERLPGPARAIDAQCERALPSTPLEVFPAFFEAALAQAQ